MEAKSDWLALFDESEKLMTKSQIALVDSLLASPPVAARALEEWSQITNLDDLDNASFRLLPLLYARHGRSPALGKEHNRIKGIYRYFFYRNNRFMIHSERILRALRDADIDFIVFKGASIALNYHDSAATRPFGDCDILVRPDDKSAAETILEENGLRYRYDTSRRSIDQHSHDFVDSVGNGFDLHWYALLENCEPRIDDALWRRSYFMEWRGLRLRILRPEDELLIAAANAVREARAMRYEWFYDASMMFDRAPAFSWEIIQEEVSRRNLRSTFCLAASLLARFVPTFPRETVENLFRLQARDELVERLTENRFVRPEPALDKQISLLINTDTSNDVKRSEWIKGQFSDSDDNARGPDRVRYDLHADGTVSDLYILENMQEWLAALFDKPEENYRDRAVLINRRWRQYHFRIEAGAVSLPDPKIRRAWSSAITAETSELVFEKPEHPCHTIRTHVKNNSSKPWFVHPECDCRIGLSYHLIDEDGNLIQWDFPRHFFLIPTRDEITVFLPGAKIELDLQIRRPPMRGRFFACLDVEHETVMWLNSHVSLDACPRVAIDVL